MNMYRQGDILIVECSDPQGPFLEPIFGDNRGIVLAEGEVTGHCHAIPEVEVTAFGVMLRPELVISPIDFTIVHPEHDTVRVPAGSYRIIPQREYDPFGDRMVMD